MGSFFSKLFRRKKKTQILMVGLDAAGKSTILCHLKLEKFVKCHPTIGFNLETVNYKNIEFNIWDVGGQDQIRPLWRHYFEGIEGLIFVVDSADEPRLPEAAEELSSLAKESELEGVPFLIFANKADLSHALPYEDVMRILQVHTFKDRDIQCVRTCAVDGLGLHEGLEWLGDRITSDKK
ncbi:Small GTPase superfamily, ARF/SAR type like protein [Aduncisulcus paluster]|uniref:Small GTPase superfamily, ARF/SAR type like protein n=1 Tax=Aduncisulcus paluster TaxID=2918883 RepID=A0ABQ5KTW1_9EUKA|nr:Small GTPase superfamily, ARF/SAR type like protein [Aduncisulcus paluster]